MRLKPHSILLAAMLSFTASAPVHAQTAKTMINEVKEMYVCPDTHVTLAQAERYGLECAAKNTVLAVVQRMIDTGWTLDQIIETVSLFTMGRKVLPNRVPTGKWCGSGARMSFEFFLAGSCPLAREWVLNSLSVLVKDLGKNMDWSPYYILSIKSNGRIESLRGEAELLQAYRGICVREKFGADAWLTYYQCMAGEGEPPWTDCAFAARIGPEQINACVNDEAPALALTDVRKNTEYNITGSPTFVINCMDKYMGNVPPMALKAMICDQFGAVRPLGCSSDKE